MESTDGPIPRDRDASRPAGRLDASRRAGPAGAVPSRPSLFQQIRLARLWLPVAIVGVVLAHQLLFVPLGGPAWRFWAQLLFYSILGPAVTFATLDWIASEVRERERAQAEMARLFAELQEHNALLSALQRVTERFAAAPDLEGLLDAAAEGIAEATGARAVDVRVGAGAGRAEVRRARGLDEALADDADARARALRGGLEPPPPPPGTTLLAQPLGGGGDLEGVVHAWFAGEPEPERREAFSILAGELGAAAEASYARTLDLLTLFDVDRSIRAEGNLERLLEALLDRMMGRAGATGGGVYLVDETGALQLHVTAGDALGSVRAAATPPLRVGEGPVGEVGRDLDARILPRVSEAERLAGAPVLQGAGSAALLPMAGEGGLVGVVALAHPEEERFAAADLSFLELLASHVSLAVRNARAYLQSEELAIVEERNRIAREIHDGVAQSLAFSALKLDLVRRLMRRDVDKAENELDAVTTTVRELIKEVRRSIFALRPIDLERHGFVETVRRYVADYGQQNELHVELELGALPDLSLKDEAVLFRIFQEAMNNVAKHARARTVRVALSTDERGRGFVEVADDGVGFDPELVGDRVTSAGGLGLRQMGERLAARGGTLDLDSASGRGTRLRASLPG